MENEELICEGESKTVKCENGGTVSVSEIKYGRENNSPDVCKSKTSGGSCSFESVPKATLTKYQRLCDTQENCQITTGNSDMGGDPCRGIRKYARVFFACPGKSEVMFHCVFRNFTVLFVRPSKCLATTHYV